MNEPPDDARGLVDPARGLRHFELYRFAPQPPLDRFVDRYWVAQWDLEEPFDQKVVSFPAAYLLFENGKATLSTRWREEFVRHLEGRGQVVSVMFRAGGFQPFLGASMAEIAERELTIGDLFGFGGDQLAHTVGEAGADLPAAVDAIDAFLTALVPSEPGSTATSETISQIVELIQADPSLGRVADLAERLGTSPRQLQRLFARYVGANPKFVIQRARVHLAAEAARHHDPDWSRLAAELGYSDQAHLTRSFTESIGSPPATYAKSLTPPGR